jgi:hypothetical protein
VTEISIASRDYWFRETGSERPEWALADSTSSGALVYCISDNSVVSDESHFPGIDEARSALTHQGFALLRETPWARTFFRPPSPPFTRRPRRGDQTQTSGSPRSSRASQPASDQDADTRWLERYIENAVRRDLCTKIGCTTCGASEFRKGITRRFATHAPGRDLLVLDEDSAMAVATALAGLHPNSEDERTINAVRMILDEVWRATCGTNARAAIVDLLSETWCGSVMDG